MKLKCVKEWTKHDPFYGTGKWEPGEIKAVDDDVAEKMLRHKTIWAEVTEATSNPLTSANQSTLDILDLTIPEIKECLPNQTDEQLAQLIAAEQAGKTRKMLMAALLEEVGTRTGE